MGNQMFQYAFGKLLEKNRKIKVYFICSKKDFKLGVFKSISFIDSSNFFIFFIFRLLIKIKFRYFEYHSCVENVAFDNIPNFSLVSGYFQSSDILEQNKVFLKSLFEVSSFQVQKTNNCTIHIRGGDYLTTVFSEINSSPSIPSYWFYRQIQYLKSNYSIDTAKVVSDDLGYARELLSDTGLELIAFQGDAISDFIQLMTSSYLIISNSSFAWWAAFLNVHENPIIIAPKNWVGYHVNLEYPKGIMNQSFLWR